MMQTIQGEAPFQVLASNFSIGPTASGYTLQISADGKNYSNLFSVGADVTRLVTNVANGSYYRLSGNVGKAVVNWRTQCNDGEGGGSGSGSTVSVTQVLSAGTKVATITVDGNGTDIFAPEGGQDGGDYKVVSELPATAETGQLFYVPEHSSGTSTTLSGWEIFCEAENDIVGTITDEEEINIELNTGEGGDFRLNDEWIGTSNTFREIRGINDQLDVVAKCDGQGHCWIYVITPGNFYFNNMSMEETTTVEDSTYDYPGEIIPAATYRYLNGQFELIPEGSLVHLQTLSGVTGATDMLYEADGQLFWWNPNSGYCAEWDGLPVSGVASTIQGFSFALNYAEIPDGTVIAEYSYISNSNHSRIIKNGDNLEVRYETDNYEIVRQSGATGETITGLTSNGGTGSGAKFIINFEPYSIIFRPESLIYFSSFWDGFVNTAHWEMVTKSENKPFTAQQDGVPVWDKSGKIIAKRFNVFQATSYINNSGATKPANILYNSSSAQLPRYMFFPTSGGTEGQVLTSAGNAEPVWTTLIKSVKVTSAEYEALVQAGTTDPNTLYLIDDE